MVSDLGTFLQQPWLYFTTAMFAALMIVYVWKQPHRPGTRQFFWLIGTYLLWALAAAFSTLSQSLLIRYPLFVLESLCALVISGFELMVVLEYTGGEKWISRSGLLLLSIAPLVLITIAIVDPGALTAIQFNDGDLIMLGGGPVKWGFYTYCAAIFLVCLSVLLITLLRAPAFRAPLLLLIVGAVTPVVTYAWMRPELLGVPPIQVVILVTNVTMLTYFVALYNFGILRVMPVARDVLISRMPYGLIVLDAENHLVDFNAAAESLPGLQGKLIMQRAASRVLNGWWDRICPLIGPEPLAQDVDMQTDQGDRIFRVTSLPLLQLSGWRSGQVLLIEDVTQARQAQLRQQQAQRSLAALQERERLARELHDSLGQTLAATHLQAGAAKVFLSQGETTATVRCLEQVTELTIAAEADVREYLLGAKLSFGADHRFFPALRQYIGHLKQQYGLQVELIVPSQTESQGLEPSIEIQLMRIIQEALSNIRKHAHTKNAQVIFTDAGPLMHVAIVDDGEGFDQTEVEGRVEGFGLQAMRERTEALGGLFEVISQQGRGTKVTVELPLQRELER